MCWRCRLQQLSRRPADRFEAARAPATSVPDGKGDFFCLSDVVHVLGLQLLGQGLIACEQNEFLVDEQAQVIEVRGADDRPGRVDD